MYSSYFTCTTLDRDHIVDKQRAAIVPKTQKHTHKLPPQFAHYIYMNLLFLLRIKFKFLQFLIIYYQFDSFKTKPIQQSNSLYFDYPIQPVNNPNFTIAALFPVRTPDNTVDTTAGTGLITTICQVENYNQGKGNVSVKGTFNVMAYASYSDLEAAPWTLLRRVLAQNLYYKNNSESFGDLKNTPMNSLIRQSTIRGIGLDFGILTGVGLPSIDFIPDDVIKDSSEGPLIYPNIEYAQGTVLISQISAFLLAARMFSTFIHYNWTLVGAVFSTSIGGFRGQDAFQNIAYNYKNINVACTSVVDPNNPDQISSSLNDFSNCVSSIYYLNTIVIWMEIGDAITVSNTIKNIIGSSRSDLVFIYPGVAAKFESINLPITSMFFQKINDSNTSTNTPFKCSREALDKIIDTLGVDSINQITIKYGNCLLTDPSLPICDPSRAKDDYTCLCENDQSVKRDI